MFRATMVCLLALLFPATAHALYTSFEDLVPESSYIVDDSFTSNGISFGVVSLSSYASGIGVSEYGAQLAAGTGLGLFMGCGIGLDFQLPSAVHEISLRYGAYCGSGIVEVNGESNTDISAPMWELNGVTLGGVLIEVTSQGTPGGCLGMLKATGDIESFIIGGTEFALDDVSVTVPEPSGATFLITFLAVFVGWRFQSNAARRKGSAFRE